MAITPTSIGGLSQGFASPVSGACAKLGSKLLQTAIPAITHAPEALEEEEEKEEEFHMSSLVCEDLCTTTWGICDTVVGVLGGGQLGRMLCQAASPMGIRVSVLDPMEECPAGRIAYHHQVGSFRDTDAVREFAQGCGALTIEIEHVDVETLEALAREGVDVEPKPFTIRVIQVSEDSWWQNCFC